MFFCWVLVTVSEHNTNYLLGMIPKQICGLLWPLWVLAEMQWECVFLVTSCMLLEDMMVKHTLIPWSLMIPRQMNGHRYSFWSDHTLVLIFYSKCASFYKENSKTPSLKSTFFLVCFESFFPLGTILRWLILNRELLISNKLSSFLLHEYGYFLWQFQLLLIKCIATFPKLS